MTLNDCFNSEDEKNITHRIVANMTTLELNYRLSSKDIDTFYENCFRIYDHAKGYNPGKHGKILQYTVLKLSDLVINTFDELKEEYIEKGYEEDKLKYRLILYNCEESKYFAKFLFNRKKLK